MTVARPLTLHSCTKIDAGGGPGRNYHISISLCVSHMQEEQVNQRTKRVTVNNTLLPVKPSVKALGRG